MRALAVGDSAGATAEDTVAIGGAAKANATGAVAIGKDALANQEAGTAVGIAAEATGQYAAAFGDAAKASVRWGTAIGTGSLANVAAGAVGYDPSGAFHSGDTTGTWKATLGAVAVGDTTRNKTRQIIGVAAGTNDTDAVNVAQLKAAQLGGGGDSSWVIQDTNSPQGRKTIDKNNPLTVRGDRYIKAEVGYDGLNLKLDENQLNNSISNNSTVQNNRTDINNLKSGFNLKAGSATSQVRLGEGTTPTIEFATADDTMTVNLSDKKVTYGIDKNKLVKNITGDLITNINNSTTTPITNIKAQFGVTADSGSQKTVTLTKDTTPTVKFKGDGKYLTSVTDTDGVQYSVDENKLNQNITNITNEAIKGKGLYFGANSGATVLNKLGSTVKIQGEGTKADSEYSGENIKTKVSQDASGNTNINMMLASALNGITSISNGKAGSSNTTITLGDGTVNVGGSTISNVKSALNGTALANASEDQKKSAATIGDLKDAVNNATLGKGLYFGANSGATVLNKLESTVKIQGEGTKADSEYSGQNVKTKISQDANGNTVIDLMLAKKAVFDSVTTGNTIIDNRGLTVGGTTYVSDSGLNAGGKKITNVADGTDPHDAVNVSQLNKVVAGATTKVADGKNTTVTSETNANGSKTYHVNLNDDITLGTDPSKQISIKGTEGTIKAGKVTVDGSKGTVNGLTNLTWDPNHFTSGQAATEDQLKAVAGQITKAAKQSSVSAGKNITVTKGTNADGGVDYKVATADDLNLNSVTTGTTVINDKGLTVGGTTYVSKDGLNAGDKKIINVAPGEISKNSTDAVNGGQLYQTNEALNKIGGAINNMDNRINRVGAGAAALAALHPLDFDPDSKWDFAAGYGNYKGANAVAVGAYYRPNEDTMISVGGSMGGGQNMINAGVSLKIGRGNHVSTSRVAMAKEIKDLRAELENMKGALMKVSEGRPLDSLDMDKMQLFPDVPANHWAYDYVATLAGNGVIVGYPDGQFGGDRMMTRYEMAALIYRAMQNGAAADDRMARALKEFEPELERIRVDTITKHKDGTPDIQRVRVIKGRG